MNKSPKYSVLIGIGLLTIVVLVLVASPNFIFTPAITVLGDDPNKSTTDQVFVTTRTDFSSAEQMSAFPLDIGKWHGHDYATAPYVAELKAKTVLIRGYDSEAFTQPLFLVVVQGNSDSDIHDPRGCFPDTQEQANEQLLITDSTWTKGNASVTLPLNMLVSVPKATDGTPIERRIVTYFYVKDNQYYSDAVALVEVQGLAPLQGLYAGTLQTEKDFLSQVVPLMFQPAVDNAWQPLFLSLAGRGIGGDLVITILLLIPAGFILYPLLRRRRVAR